MPDYKGIPFDGGLDSPSGTGAQQIVTTLKAIIDFLVNCSAPATLRDLAAGSSIEWDARFMRDAAGNLMMDYGHGTMAIPGIGENSLDWANAVLFGPGNADSVRYRARQLIDGTGGVIQLQWDIGLQMPNLPNADPGIPNRLWNNAGVVSISL